jgi:hypothetical protein
MVWGSKDLQRVVLAFCHCDKISEIFNLEGGKNYFGSQCLGMQVCGQLIPLLLHLGRAEYNRV